MKLERKTLVNAPNLNEQSDALFQYLQNSQDADSGVFLSKLAEFMQMYSGAMKGVSARLEVLDDEFQLSHEHNPIHHIECRIKGISSIFEKIRRYDLPFSLDSARMHIHDIAGIRVVCNFLDDIYAMEALLLNQPDITLINRKDYIAKPKESGYRSLHLVVKAPVFLSNKSEEIPVEIQLRTIAMDYWASLEHMLQYKNSKNDMQKYSAMLLECADSLANTEKTMQHIRENIEK